MPWLKGLVVALAVLIAAGVAALLYGFATKLGKPPSAETARPASGAPAKAFGKVDLALPAGCSIESVSSDGSRFVVLIGPAGSECERVVVLDAAKGSVLGEIRPRP